MAAGPPDGSPGFCSAPWPHCLPQKAQVSFQTDLSLNTADPEPGPQLQDETWLTSFILSFVHAMGTC